MKKCQINIIHPDTHTKNQTNQLFFYSHQKSQQEVQPLMFKVKSEQVGLNKYIQSLDQSILKTSESIKTKVSDIAIADRNRLERKKRQIGEL